jgi:glycolate oxidase FAD binding subunit
MFRTRWSRPEQPSGSDASLGFVGTSMKTSLSIAEKFASIVGAANVRAATTEDAVAGAQPEYVVSPGTEHELAAVLACADEAGVSVIPRGGGTKLDWGNPPTRAEIILSTLRLNRVLEHAWSDLTVVVEAGCTLKALQDALAQHGQRLAVDVLWPERATVGGVLSTNDSGALRLRYGALRDLIIGVTLALPDGTLASSGGKVVKNVAGYDLPKLVTGAFGTLGVITRAIFRLHPLPRTAVTLTCVTNRIDEAKRWTLRLLDSTLACAALQARFIANREPEISIDVLFEGTQVGIAEQCAHVKSLAGQIPVSESSHSVWRTREILCPEDGVGSGWALLKISAQPTDAMGAIGNLCAMLGPNVKFDAVVQATGLGTVLLKGGLADSTRILRVFRQRMEEAGGSLVLLRKSPSAQSFDAWGDPGDAIGVMRALKQQLDPRATLNPGRFVGGI